MHRSEEENKEPPVDRKISGSVILLSFQGGGHLVFVLFGIIIFLVALSSWSDLTDKDKFIDDYMK